jgi:phage-related protein
VCRYRKGGHAQVDRKRSNPGWFAPSSGCQAVPESGRGRPSSTASEAPSPVSLAYLFFEIQCRVAWRVELLDKRVERELSALAQDVRQRFLRIAELIEQHGVMAMHEPHVKHVEGKLWEMRMKGRDGIARAIYLTAAGERVVVLHAFDKKTQKTPARALEVARERAKQVK